MRYRPDCLLCSRADVSIPKEMRTPKAVFRLSWCPTRRATLCVECHLSIVVVTAIGLGLFVAVLYIACQLARYALPVGAARGDAYAEAETAHALRVDVHQAQPSAFSSWAGVRVHFWRDLACKTFGVMPRASPMCWTFVSQVRGGFEWCREAHGNPGYPRPAACLRAHLSLSEHCAVHTMPCAPQRTGGYLNRARTVIL